MNASDFFEEINVEDRPLPFNYCDFYADRFDDGVCWTFHTDRVEFYLKVIFVSLFILTGVVGNILLSLTVLISPRLRTRSINIFIANLSISNVIQLLVVAPIVTIDNMAEFFLFGELGCKIKPVLMNVFFIVPMLSILVISIDRFLAIRFPFRDLTYSFTAIFVCVLIWIIAVGVSSVEANTQSFHTFPFLDIDVNLCFSKWYFTGEEDADGVWQKQRIYKLSVLALIFFLPFTGVIVFYSCLLLNMKRFYKKIGLVDKTHRTNVRNIANMVVLVLSSTVACWSPLAVFWLQKYAPELPGDYEDNSQFLRTENRSMFFFIAECLAFVYSCIQPAIFFLTGTKLRTELLRLLACKSPSLPPPPPQTHCVVSDEDEGFSSGSDKDNTSEYETDLTNDVKEVPIRKQSEKKLSVIVVPPTDNLERESSPAPQRRLSRRFSFFADIDPNINQSS